MNVTVNPIKSPELPVVAWHDGGQMFAGDEQPYEQGWYFYPGKGRNPILVDVREPFSNESYIPE